MQRVIRLEGANNFRDLGGYPAADGRTVRWGRLYRSDHFAKLSDADLAVLNRLGLRTLIDFRSDAERVRHPNRLAVAQVVQLDPANLMAQEAAQAWAGGTAEEEAAFLIRYARSFGGSVTAENNPIYGMYRKLVSEESAIAAYRNMLQLLADPGTPPVVMHCRGGKDRTGYGAAVLLYLLGVPMEHIVEDYLLTGKLREARNNYKYGQYRALTDDPDILDFLMSLIDTREVYIASAFEEMRRIAGSADAYLEQVLGATPALVHALRALYLEPEG